MGVSRTKDTRTIFIAIFMALSFMGCAKNVDRIQFEKWGNSYVPRGTSVDTTANGGVENGTLPQSPNYSIPKASVGGAYHRTFATSASGDLLMVGGFHVVPGQ